MNEFKILTYNIFYELMLKSHGPYNINSFIEYEGEKEDFDFIFLQEATNYDKIKYLHSYDNDHYSSGRDEIVNFWNKKRYKSFHNKFGSEFQKTRPILISFLEDLNTKEKILLINVHYKHNETLKTFCEELENILLKTYLKGDISSFDYVILGGDFNIEEGEDLKIMNRILKYSNHPFNTCCRKFENGKYEGYHARKLDKIFYSGKFSTVHLPRTVDNHFDKDTFELSDHLPLICFLVRNKIEKKIPITTSSPISSPSSPISSPSICIKDLTEDGRMIVARLLILNYKKINYTIEIE